MKQVSEWQATEGDERVQSRLMKTVERLMKFLEEIIPSIPRYESYVRRFANSISLVDRGDRDYVCKPTIDSIHNIWFEFHEDILSVLLQYGRGMREAVATTKADVISHLYSRQLRTSISRTLAVWRKGHGPRENGEIRIPIPPAFVVGTNGFHHFRSQGGRVDADLMGEVDGALRRLENLSGKTFAGAEQPLLVSVRSGAAISMPGMMDTILNLGLDARSAHQLAQTTGKPEFAIDTWMRFWRMFTDTVLNLDPDELTASVAECVGRARSAVTQDVFDALENAILTHIADSGEEASSDPHVQLKRTIEAVFSSWDSARAKAYRAHHGIADDLGTAITVQAMVFGNADARSGSGVAFTRNPNDGENSLYGEYLIGRQGEDLVSGTHTPIDLSDPQALEKPLRDALIRYGKKLEELYRDAVDIEFTVEAGELYLLQVRPAKRTAAAAVRIAEDLVAEGLISQADALKRISLDQIRKLLRPVFDERALAAAKTIALGLGSSPGQAHGVAVLDSDRAAERVAAGDDVILVRPTTSPQDIRGMLSANGIVTAKGGALSHAAVVSRALDKPCIVGCESIKIDLERRNFTIEGRQFLEGDPVSIDGTTGKVFEGALPLHAASAHKGSLQRILGWADASSEAIIWVAPRGSDEFREALKISPPGLGVIGLTDVLISCGSIDRFIDLIRSAGQDKPPAATSDAISEIVVEACRPVLADAAGVPLDIRLPRVSSDRARRMIEDWTELPPGLFLPLGAIAYIQSILRGLAAAAKGLTTSASCYRTHRRDRGSLPEFDRFKEEAKRVGSLAAGAVLQNFAALQGGGRPVGPSRWPLVDRRRRDSANRSRFFDRDCAGTYDARCVCFKQGKSPPIPSNAFPVSWKVC